MQADGARWLGHETSWEDNQAKWAMMPSPSLSTPPALNASDGTVTETGAEEAAATNAAVKTYKKKKCALPAQLRGIRIKMEVKAMGSEWKWKEQLLAFLPF
uniref:Uncharacterized protein n=1 Tax=Globodera rostochiensis TaxID=31243 RepID=A0A914HTK1_GLORO